MYADTHIKLEAATEMIESLSDKYPRFVKRLQDNLDRSAEWVKLFRLNIPSTRNNNTNNYAEASIRIMKDVLLHRTKAFNVVALVEYLTNSWELYCKARLVHFATHRKPEGRVAYEKMCRQMQSCNMEKAVHVDEFTWEVPSASSPDKYYCIDTEVGLCSCPSGNQGSFCKHQACIVPSISSFQICQF
jgi:hypothetical protein